MDPLANMAASANGAQSRASETQLVQQRAKLAAIGQNGADMAAIDQAAQEFEAVFLSQMLKGMFNTVENDDLHGGFGEDMFEDLLVEEYGKIVSEAGGVGIADHVKAELLKLQEQGQQ